MAGKIIVNCGSMFSGKSTELIRQGERNILAGKKVIFLKPSLDVRYAEGAVSTHNGNMKEAIRINTNTSILIADVIEAEVVLIDEIQFFKDRTVQEIMYLRDMGITVYVSGLDMNYRGEPFGIMPNLLAIADKIQKFNAICVDCGEDAYISARITENTEEIEVGSVDKYKPLCYDCYRKYLKGGHN